MRIAVASVQVPFIMGGAELMTQGLLAALQRAGHEVELVTMPFRFGPASGTLSSMSAWEEQDFDQLNCGPIDIAIALKFPAFYLRHHDKRVWLMHQHRSCYELFDTPYGDRGSDQQAVHLRSEVVRRDTASLQSARKVFTISPTVSERLLQFNGVHSEPLLQPPAHPEQFFSAEEMPFIFAPSRLEALKRHELLIRAMPMVDAPLYAVIAGDGGMKQHLHQVVAELGLQHRVRFIGRASDAELRRHYAHALGVFFGPLLEDYGFITLEAMLSARPVITCSDSGGPTHFVVDGQTGHVTEPEPEAVAAAINALWADRRRARELGENARRHYDALNISWDNVVARLLTD